MNYFVGSWTHYIPEKNFNNNKRILIKRLCFGPLETIIFGIEKINKLQYKYFFEHNIIEGIEEEFIFKYINKKEILENINNEISICKKLNNEFYILFEIEKQKIESNNYI